MTFLVVWGEFLDNTYSNKNFDNHYIGPLFKKDDYPVGKPN